MGGSSPRMRGAPAHSRPRGFSRGIIPADAGSTVNMYPSFGLNGDHPRGCGEHRPSFPLVSISAGSSPRMRGAQLLRIVSLWAIGIIPADAGSTGKAATRPTGTGDHPRGCGEHEGVVGWSAGS